VRQLKNVMERCQALVRSPIITAHDLELHTTAISTSAVHAEPTDLTDAVAGLERRMIEAALAESGGNRAEAARHLGINRQLLYTKMKRYGLSEAEASEIPTRDVGNDDA